MRLEVGDLLFTRLWGLEPLVPGELRVLVGHPFGELYRQTAPYTTESWCSLSVSELKKSAVGPMAEREHVPASH